MGCACGPEVPRVPVSGTRPLPLPGRVGGGALVPRLRRPRQLRPLTHVPPSRRRGAGGRAEDTGCAKGRDLNLGL